MDPRFRSGIRVLITFSIAIGGLALQAAAEPGNTFVDRRGAKVTEPSSYLDLLRTLPGELPQAGGQGTQLELALDGSLQDRAEKLLEGALSDLQGRLQQPRDLRSTLIAMIPKTGEVLVLAAHGLDRYGQSLDVTLDRHEAGSVFKPIVFAAALHTGRYTPQTNLRNAPEVLDGQDLGDLGHSAPVTFRDAMVNSMNHATIRIAMDIGLERVIAMARALGIDSPLAKQAGLSLGVDRLTLLELVTAYATIANQGASVRPRFLLGPPAALRKAEEPQAGSSRALSAAEARVMTELLGAALQIFPGLKDFEPRAKLAGKRGATGGNLDGWMIGYSADLAVGVWIGAGAEEGAEDLKASLPATAVSVWSAFVKETLSAVPK